MTVTTHGVKRTRDSRGRQDLTEGRAVQAPGPPSPVRPWFQSCDRPGNTAGPGGRPNYSHFMDDETEPRVTSAPQMQLQLLPESSDGLPLTQGKGQHSLKKSCSQDQPTIRSPRACIQSTEPEPRQPAGSWLRTLSTRYRQKGKGLKGKKGVSGVLDREGFFS